MALPRKLGNLDRIVAGLLRRLPLSFDPAWRRCGRIGARPVITGLAGRCGAYRPPGLGSCTLPEPQ